jgi:flagellar hook-associated protein 1 FlgK
VPDLFSITTSALQAFQTAIAVTSNNIANASTPGYSDESVNLVANPPQSNGSIQVGDGVDVAGISRAYSQLAVNQYNTSQSSLGQLNALQNYTNQIDNIVGTTAGGLTTALQSYYNAWSTLASNPTSTAGRQALLSQAKSVATSIQTTSSQLQSLDTNVNNGVASDVQQINSLSGQIATLNAQIVAATGANGGVAPNTLLDQRGTLITSLANLTGVTTTTNTDGSVNVFTGNGTALVLDQQANPLTTVANPFNAQQLEVASAANPANIISSQLTSGDIGGLLAARTQAIDPAINNLGLIATTLSQAANAQQGLGVDLNGNLGSPLFSTASPLAVPSGNNTGGASVSASLIANDGTNNATSTGALTGDNYVLSYAGSTYTLTDQTTGTSQTVTPSGTSGTGGPVFSVAGVTISLSKVPASGDQFLIEPTAPAAASFSVALTSTAQIAAAGALQASAADANGGTATIGSPTVNKPYPPAASVLTPYNIVFTSPTAYSIVNPATSTSVGGGTYTPGSPISFNGWSVTISGTPAANDSFSITPGASGNNANALASAAQENTGVLQGGTTSLTSAVNALVTGIGSQASQVNTAQTAQAAINTQAQQSVQSVSGVSLDTEAANLLQYQQAYQAAAQALTIGNQLFTTLIDSVNGTYS